MGKRWTGVAWSMLAVFVVSLVFTTILAAWYASWPWYPTLALALVFAPLLFPTGRLLSPRWRPAAWLAGAATATFTVLAALQPDLDPVTDHVIANPIGVAGIGNPEESTVGGIALLILIILLGLGRSCRWCSGSGGREARSASSSSGSPPRARCCRSRRWATPCRRRWAMLSSRSPSCSCRSRPGSRSCATGCTTSTG